MEKGEVTSLLLCYAFELIHNIHNLRRADAIPSPETHYERSHSLSLSLSEGGIASRHTASRDAGKNSSPQNNKEHGEKLSSCVAIFFEQIAFLEVNEICNILR